MTERVAREIQLLERPYEVFDKFVDQSKLDSKEVENIKEDNNALTKNYGAEIKSITTKRRSKLPRT
jgi:hypothetical protein